MWYIYCVTARVSRKKFALFCSLQSYKFPSLASGSVSDRQENKFDIFICQFECHSVRLERNFHRFFSNRNEINLYNNSNLRKM